MEKVRILWTDDEIEFLKPHILFLQEKGYDVETANNGTDALDMIAEKNYDIVFLDENMPGLSGIEVLNRIKTSKPSLPVVMITKSEEENIMEDAIGGKIADYLIKPVNPNQILMALKKTLDNKRIVNQKTSSAYQQEFRNIGMKMMGNMSLDEWYALYMDLIYWELELGNSDDESLQEAFRMQKTEANKLFARYYEKNYKEWLNGKSDDTPLLSHTLLKSKLFPLLDQPEPVFLVVIDNLRYDQWKIISRFLQEYYHVESDEMYLSIMPTATQYARNSLFSGLMPAEIQRKYPKYWLNEDDEGSKNDFESELFAENLRRHGKQIKFSYNKILSLNAGKRLADSMSNLLANKLNIIVYNFVDMLSHSRTEMEVIKELAADESAYRSITASWFEHSPLFDILKTIAEKQARVMITTDHGSIRVQVPEKVIGDRNTNTNLRYKQGRSLNYDAKSVFEMRNPEEYFLPKPNVSTRYIFASDTQFFVYPNNYNHFVNFYKDTFQHGGISLEEVIIPAITLKAK
ncbi:MAG: PglZ domain-containing protein [Bacteroidetes bacterium]|nr:PglZ domain-containing protein [Bacteroidota bacterium]MBU1719028.1 PglZ domain-containing protein [Bacteroidota bacterium]